jgi:voltage-gated potassium channel Kch
MRRLNVVERQFESFLRKPLSVRKAMAVIVSATIVSVLIGGVLMTILDGEEFPNVGIGMWWALQTVTTVGYGDVAPENPAGRVVGALIMLEAIAFIAIVTAAITSSFVERARREHAAASTESSDNDELVKQLSGQLAEISSRLETIQHTLDRSERDRRG